MKWEASIIIDVSNISITMHQCKNWLKNKRISKQAENDKLKEDR